MVHVLHVLYVESIFKFLQQPLQPPSTLQTCTHVGLPVEYYDCTGTTLLVLVHVHACHVLYQLVVEDLLRTMVVDLVASCTLGRLHGAIRFLFQSRHMPQTIMNVLRPNNKDKLARSKI